MKLKDAEEIYLHRKVKHKKQDCEFKIMSIMEVGAGHLQFIFEPGPAGFTLGDQQTVTEDEIINDWGITITT